MPVVAAIVATLGDLLMLAVANGGREQLGLPRLGAGVLWVGTALGVVAIPCYAAGYRMAARRAAPGSAGAAALVERLGFGVAAVGTLIHGLTGWHVRAGLEAGVPGRNPLAAVADLPVLVALWAVGTLLVLGASAAFALGVTRTRARRLAWLTPALVTVVLALSGPLSPWLAAFLVPAAPNLAHVVFFAACAASARTRRSAGGDER